MENTQPTSSLEVMPPPSQRYVAMAEERSLNFLNPKLWSAMKVVAETFMQAGALPASIKNAQQLLMMLQAGYEAGLQPLEAIKSFYFVNGNLALYGEMAITMVIRAGHKIEWGTCNDKTATVTITRKDTGQTMTNTLTMQQAIERRLDMGREGRKDPWVKHPENMLKFKVFHMTAKFVCPDAFHGVNEIGELEDERATVKGDIISSSSKPVIDAAILPTTSEHKPLEEVLTEPEAPKEEEPRAKRKAKATEEPKAEEAPVETSEQAEPTERPESEEERCERLIYEEVEGRKLTAREMMDVNAYQAKKKAQSNQ